jgi:hypothetical protein
MPRRVVSMSMSADYVLNLHTANSDLSRALVVWRDDTPTSVSDMSVSIPQATFQPS